MTLHWRGTCAVCGRQVSVKIPKGGDGTQVNPFRHRKPHGGGPCDGHYYATVETALRS